MDRHQKEETSNSFYRIITLKKYTKLKWNIKLKYLCNLTQLNYCQLIEMGETINLIFIRLSNWT